MALLFVLLWHLAIATIDISDSPAHDCSDSLSVGALEIDWLYADDVRLYVLGLDTYMSNSDRRRWCCIIHGSCT
jgi:hypothetical protein